MAQDAVNKIMSAEKAAADKVAEAEVVARQIISDAEKAGRESLLKAEECAETLYHSRLEAADKEAENAVGTAIAESEKEGEKLAVLAKGKMDAATALIAERVVNG